MCIEGKCRVRYTEIYILIEATYSQKVCATSLSTGDQGGAPTLGQWPLCYRVWNEIDILK